MHSGRSLCRSHRRSPRLPPRHRQDPDPVAALREAVQGPGHGGGAARAALPWPVPGRVERDPGDDTVL